MKEKIRPKIIAWSKGMTVIPFENVLAVGEDPMVDGQLVVGLNTSVKESSKMIIPHGDVEAFLEQYNTYLAAVESLTVQVQLDEAGMVVK